MDCNKCVNLISNRSMPEGYTETFSNSNKFRLHIFKKIFVVNFCLQQKHYLCLFVRIEKRTHNCKNFLKTQELWHLWAKKSNQAIKKEYFFVNFKCRDSALRGLPEHHSYITSTIYSHSSKYAYFSFWMVMTLLIEIKFLFTFCILNRLQSSI